MVYEYKQFNISLSKFIHFSIDSKPYSFSYKALLQTDIILLDFSKAFDRVAHKCLCHKLCLCCLGRNESLLEWIQSFLNLKASTRLISWKGISLFTMIHAVTSQIIPGSTQCVVPWDCVLIWKHVREFKTWRIVGLTDWRELVIIMSWTGQWLWTVGSCAR